jgi:alpha-L-fucosidase 2
VINCGSVTANDTSLIIKNANEVTIYISIATNFNNYHDISGDENEEQHLILIKYIQNHFSKYYLPILQLIKNILIA